MYRTGELVAQLFAGVWLWAYGLWDEVDDPVSAGNKSRKAICIFCKNAADSKILQIKRPLN